MRLKGSAPVNRRVKSTRIVITALTLKGRRALTLQKADEVEMRAKYKGFKSWHLPFNVRSYLKTVSLFMPKVGAVERHDILGFKKMGDSQKANFYLGISRATAKSCLSFHFCFPKDLFRTR